MTESMIERLVDARKAMTELKKLLEVYAPAEHHWKNLDPLLDRIDAALIWPPGSADIAGVPMAEV